MRFFVLSLLIAFVASQEVVVPEVEAPEAIEDLMEKELKPGETSFFFKVEGYFNQNGEFFRNLGLDEETQHQVNALLQTLSGKAGEGNRRTKRDAETIEAVISKIKQLVGPEVVAKFKAVVKLKVKKYLKGKALKKFGAAKVGVAKFLKEDDDDDYFTSYNPARTQTIYRPQTTRRSYYERPATTWRHYRSKRDVLDQVEGFFRKAGDWFHNVDVREEADKLKTKAKKVKEHYYKVKDTMEDSVKDLAKSMGIKEQSEGIFDDSLRWVNDQMTSRREKRSAEAQDEEAGRYKRSAVDEFLYKNLRNWFEEVEKEEYHSNRAKVLREYHETVERLKKSILSGKEGLSIRSKREANEKRMPGALLPFAKKQDVGIYRKFLAEGPPVPFFLTKKPVTPGKPNPLANKEPQDWAKYLQ